MYAITITKMTIEEVPAGKEWKEHGKPVDCNESRFEYTPEIVKKKEVELKIYEQIVDELNIREVIAVINKPKHTRLELHPESSTTMEFHAGPAPGVDDSKPIPPHDLSKGSSGVGCDCPACKHDRKLEDQKED